MICSVPVSFDWNSREEQASGEAYRSVSATSMNRRTMNGVLDFVFERLQREQMIRIRVEVLSLDSTGTGCILMGSGTLEKTARAVHRQVPGRVECQASRPWHLRRAVALLPGNATGKHAGGAARRNACSGGSFRVSTGLTSCSPSSSSLRLSPMRYAVLTILNIDT